MSEVGNYIKSRREELNMSYEELYERTKIRALYLKAIEEGEFSALPGEVYLKGFLRTISRELDLDKEHVLGLYESESNRKAGTEIKEDDKKVKEKIDEKVSGKSNVIVWVIIGAIVVIGVVGFLLTKQPPAGLL